MSLRSTRSVKFLKKDKHGLPEPMERLPQIAKQLEVSLYRDAQSFEAYMNMSTLKQRLRQIAAEVGLHLRSSNDPEVNQRIRHRQQRLLLLHHSAKCPHEDGCCTVNPHCASMKQLWIHMEGCKDNQCNVAHCFSTRAILSHYRKCRDSNCPACGPVRESQRQKSLQARL
jgi:hypothetical protein